MSSEQGERTYHHGDLRRAVLAAAEEVIRAEGPQALSLRDLARRAGVSHAAPAHHFKDRTGLLTAFAAEGWALFAAALQAAPDLRERGVAYVRFAREHPAHFQVMFQPALLRTEDPALRAATATAGEALRAGVARRRAPVRRSPASPGSPPGRWRTASPPPAQRQPRRRTGGPRRRGRLPRDRGAAVRAGGRRTHRGAMTISGGRIALSGKRVGQQTGRQLTA